MRNKIILFILLVFGVSLYSQNTKPLSASEVMSVAQKDASQSKKKIFLIYHASWCKWCKKLDSALTSSELKPVLDKYFVIAHLDVNERKEKIELLENEGGRALMQAHGGEKSGLPFCVILNKKYDMLVNSNQMPDASNIGYPGSDEEIKLFTGMLKKGAPSMKKKDIEVITAYLKAHAPKQ